MENFTKYYSYNQVIEEHDVLIMTLEDLIQSKQQLDNPKVIVCVNRQGGSKEPKIPKWFQSYKKETDTKFEQIDTRFKQMDEQIPKWFQSYKKETDAKFEQIDTKFEQIDARFNQMNNQMPQWFKLWCEQEFKPLAKRIDKIENILEQNNLH